MPELPEVEITRQGLWADLDDQPKLLRIQYFRPDLRWTLPKQAQKVIPGQRLLQLRRRGKYLIFEFEKSLLISHLGMSGTWRRALSDEVLRTHDHVEFEFAGGKRFLFSDPRRFGFLQYLKSKDLEAKYFAKMGYEPLDSNWSTNELLLQLRKQNRALKVALMDQKNIVGVGNIYASESLFLAKLSPFAKVSKITLAQLQNLREKITHVLEKSIASGGSSIQDFAHSSGKRGEFQTQFLVYDREKTPCPNCLTLISSKVLGGRATYWCPRCQSGGPAKKKL